MYRLGTVSIKILGGGGLKPVLRAPNLALSFYHGSKHTVVRSAWRFSNSSMNHHEKVYLFSKIYTFKFNISGWGISTLDNFFPMRGTLCRNLDFMY